MRTKKILWIIGILILFIVGRSFGEENRKSVRVDFTDNPPKIDGRLEDGCWKNVQPVSGFFQYDPVNGTEASEKTLVWIVYDQKNLYFAFRMKDSQPEKIWSELTPRNDYRENDSITVSLDTYNDKRTSISFTVNPKGVQKNSVETIWKSEAMTDLEGWTAEMAIPFKSLRFFPENEQIWGINFERYIHRLNEKDYWTNVDRDRPLLQQMGELSGLSGIKPGYNLELFPYSGYRMSKWESLKDEKFAAGLDVKYGILPNLILDLTASPDFSEVESDPFIYQLVPYESYFRENRPFFTEGSQYFTISQGDSYHGPQESLFYSRRIDNPKIAAKLTGKTGGYSFGLLGALNDEEDQPDKMFSIVRIQKDIWTNSQIGIYYAGMYSSEDYNRNFAVDYNFNFKDVYYIQGQSAFTWNKGLSGTRNGMHTFSFRRDPDAGFQADFNFRRIEENVRIRTGFLSKTNFQNTSAELAYAWRYTQGLVKHWSFRLEGNLDQDCNGNVTGKTLGTGSSVDFFSRMEVFWRFNAGKNKYQVLDENNSLVWTQDYLNTYEGGVNIEWFRGGFLKDVNIDVDWEKGGIYEKDFRSVKSGTQTNVDTSLTLRPRSNLEFSLGSEWTRQVISQTGEEMFEGMTYESAFHFQMTRNLFLTTRLKGETRDKQYNMDFLLGYYFGAGNIIQLSFKKSASKISGLQEDGYSITLKVSYLLRI